MKVLADFHHDELYESLRILIEDRLGGDLYRPIGLEWYHEGFWQVFNHIDTATQYLGLHIGKEFEKRSTESDNFNWLNKDHDGGNEGIYVLPKRGRLQQHRAITLDRFKNTKFDVVISSMPVHFNMFEKLVSQHQPQAKHIFQMGNMWSVPSGVKNLLNSTTVQPKPDVNHVRYHQEFDLDLFKPNESCEVKEVVNMQHYMHDRASFDGLAKSLPGWSFKAYGAGNQYGPVDVNEVPNVIKEAGFVYHIKKGGEGYGYNIHHAYACGKPMITNSSYFKGMTAHPLFVHGENCIDLGACSIHDAAAMLKSASENYDLWSDKAYARFKEVVNFDEEFEAIKVFFQNLR